MDVVAVAVLAVVVMIVRAAGAKGAVAAEVEVVVLVAVGIMAVYVIVGGEAPVEEGMLVYQPVGSPQQVGVRQIPHRIHLSRGGQGWGACVGGVWTRIYGALRRIRPRHGAAPLRSGLNDE